ncbi:MAG: hypothetical protein NT014_05415 [Candidatus Omnitrophica bacterium]|nr:hypothetical protein [Candidatus Omnitrophota bacterium]
MRSIKPKSTLRKRFIAIESNSLVIETIQTESLSHRQRLRMLKLKGTWKANDCNELCFEAAARKGPPKTFTFKGSWKLNKNQQIEYVSEDGVDTLIFKGYWQLSSAKRLVYFLEGSSTSRFEFKVNLESPTLVPKAGQIRYRLGAGIRKNRLTGAATLVILYGEWKFGRNLGLIFQMDYGQGNIKSLEFGAQVTFGRNKVIFTLKNELGEPLGITLTMTHNFLETLDAQAFIRLKSRQKEQAIEAGITIPF